MSVAFLLAAVVEERRRRFSDVFAFSLESPDHLVRVTKGEQIDDVRLGPTGVVVGDSHLFLLGPTGKQPLLGIPHLAVGGIDADDEMVVWSDFWGEPSGRARLFRSVSGKPPEQIAQIRGFLRSPAITAGHNVIALARASEQASPGDDVTVVCVTTELEQTQTTIPALPGAIPIACYAGESDIVVLHCISADDSGDTDVLVLFHLDEPSKQDWLFGYRPLGFDPLRRSLIVCRPTQQTPWLSCELAVLHVDSWNLEVKASLPFSARNIRSAVWLSPHRILTRRQNFGRVRCEPSDGTEVLTPQRHADHGHQRQTRTLSNGIEVPEALADRIASGATHLALTGGDPAEREAVLTKVAAALGAIRHPEERDDPLMSFVSSPSRDGDVTELWFDAADLEAWPEAVAAVSSAVISELEKVNQGRLYSLTVRR